MNEPKAISYRRVAALCSAVAALAVVAPAFGQSPTAMKSDGSMQMKDSMSKGMKEMDAMKMTGDTDRDFAMMMKMHHQQALEMAKVEIERGKSAEMKAMAHKISEAQKKEIAQFDKFLQQK